ncbi:hypothetical protein [Brevibacillus sp. SYSU BS000544]|uniref:hypothetical protein n=1 Tax=Brevibacillus sp. SYSU BS000544 TaxID=3416443 RepID=UPI003CE56E75
MPQKEYVLGILQSLERHNDIIPAHVQETLRQVNEKISHVPADVFSLQNDRVVTVEAKQQMIAPDQPLMQLVEIYDDLSRVSREAGQNRQDFRSAVDQLRGLLGTSEGYSPE